MPQESDIKAAVYRMVGKQPPKKPTPKSQSMPVYKPATIGKPWKRGPGGKMVPPDDEPKQATAKQTKGKHS